MVVSQNTLVSVVIPAFNAEAYIGGAVESVLSQTHQNLELLVVDDGSTDDTRDTVTRIEDPRLELLSQTNEGVSRARNEGLSRTKGPFIAFLDADDYWLPEKIATQLEAFGQAPNLMAVGSLMHYVSPTGKTLGIAGKVVMDKDQKRVAEGKLMPFPISSTLFRRSAVEAAGGFDPSLQQAQDTDLLSRVATMGKISCLPRVLGAYRIHPQSKSARDLSLQLMEWRFVQERRKAEREGRTLSFSDFRSTYRPTLAERRYDFVASRYRAAGLYAAERRWGRAVLHGIQAALLGPAYTLERLRRQRPWQPKSD